jgi:hypothetical protein
MPVDIYCHTLGGLKPPALAGSFSISSLPLAEQDALDILPMEPPLGIDPIGEADLASFSCQSKPPALAGGVFTFESFHL